MVSLAPATDLGPRSARGGRWIAHAIGVTLLCLVLFATLGDEIALPQLFEKQDKIEHLLAFLGLGFVFGWGASLWALLGYAIALSGTAFGIEVLQEVLTTTREGGIEDGFAGCVGLGLGLLSAFSMRAAITWLRGLRRTGSRRRLA